MLDYLSSLSPTQWIFVGIGIFLVVLSVKDQFDFPQGNDKKEKDSNSGDDTDLTSIVAKWEDLSDSCRDANLVDAYNALQDVFPMLVNIYKPKAKK